MDGNKSFQAGGFTAGIQENSAEITIGPAAIAALPLTRFARNFSFGRRDGLTSRYGITPIPGHSTTARHYDIPTFSQTGASGGLMCSEQNYATPASPLVDIYRNRKAVLGISAITVDVDNVIPSDSIAASRLSLKIPYWITTRTNPFAAVQSVARFDFCPAIKKANASGSSNIPESRLEAGIGDGAARSQLAAASYATRQLIGLNKDILHTNIALLEEYLDLGNNPSSTWYMRSAHIKKDLAYVNTNWLMDYTRLGRFGLTSGSSIDYSITGNTVTTTWTISATNKALSFYGYPPYINNKENVNKVINGEIYFYSLFLSNNSTVISASARVKVTALSKETTADFRSFQMDQGNAIYFTTVPGITASKTFGASPGTGTGTDTTKLILPMMTSTDAAGIAQGDFIFSVIDGNAACVLAVDRIRSFINADSNFSGFYVNGQEYPLDGIQYVDPCNNEFKPQLRTTVTANSRTYRELGNGKETSFKTMSDEDVTTAADYANVINTADNEGLLESGKDYQLAYSIYNSMTGKESNVGTPVTFAVPATAAANYLWLNKTLVKYLDLISSEPPAFSGFERLVAYPSKWNLHINHLQLRFYYRQYGAFEWLAAGAFDAAKLFHDVRDNSTLTSYDALNILKVPAFGSVGGQPGGYNDYSDLENDAYIDVTTFQGRVFWCSKTSLRYSMKTDVLSYPLRNSVSVETGELRGVLPHFFQGQAEQAGRLLIFASDGVYEGRFTGDVQTQAVQVSLTADPVIVPVDGSDFTVSQRTTEVSFSSRTACVAEGVVYFMGPRGIFRDDGVQVPQRISQAIEPYYYSTFEPSKTSEFFAHFNARTREILFYFRPVVDATINTNSALTMAWVYSLRTESWQQGVPGAFMLYEYKTLIDWAQDLDTTQFQTQAKAAGMRTIIGARENVAATVSRAFYHDEACNGGDMTPGREFLCATVSESVAGTLRLTLASGFSAAALAAITAGVTKVSITESGTYGAAVHADEIAGLSITNNLNGFHLVTAKTGAYIEIAKPAAFTIGGTISLHVTQYFPVYVEGFHDVTAVIDTNYLAPEGLVNFHQFRKFHALMEPIFVQSGTGEPRVTISWGAPHEFPTTQDAKSFPITPLNPRERTTQVVVDLSNTQMSSQGQALRLNLTYPQVYGRFTLYWFRVDYNDIGEDQLMMYQRANS